MGLFEEYVYYVENNKQISEYVKGMFIIKKKVRKYQNASIVREYLKSMSFMKRKLRRMSQFSGIFVGYANHVENITYVSKYPICMGIFEGYVCHEENNTSVSKCPVCPGILKSMFIMKRQVHKYQNVSIESGYL